MSATSNFLQPYIDWLQQDHMHRIEVTGVANRSDNPLCYYLEGAFKECTHDVLSGSGKQFFSDRCSGSQPFDTNQPDYVGINIALPDGPMIMTLHSWENQQLHYLLEVKNGFLLAFAHNMMLMINLEKSRSRD